MPAKSEGKMLGAILVRDIQGAVVSALRDSDLPTSKEIKDLRRQVREVSTALKKLSEKTALRRARKKQAKSSPVRKRKKPGRKAKIKVCTVHGCKRPHYAKKLCATHYAAKRRQEVKRKPVRRQKVKRKPVLRRSRRK